MKVFDHKAQVTALLFSTLMLGVSMSSHALSPAAAIEQGLMKERVHPEITMECNDGTTFSS